MSEEHKNSLKENVEACVGMLRQALDLDDSDEWQDDPTCPLCGGIIVIPGDCKASTKIDCKCGGECHADLVLTARYQVRVR